MSGTSLDGVDAAVLETDGHRILAFGPSDFRPYSKDEQAVLRAALGLWHGPEVEAAAKVVETAHIDILSQFPGVDLIGFHGQTLAHDPRGRGTHQAGNGAAIAQALGVPVVWDFRSNDVASGGQGAPLAPFYHFACARWIKAATYLVFLNLGGVGNLTWDGALLAFDTGPANAPMNDLVKARLGVEFDKDGALAARGRVDEDAVQKTLALPFFAQIPPKSLDRDQFTDALASIFTMKTEDGLATLTAICAHAVAAGLSHLPTPAGQILVTGGGRWNATLMKRLSMACKCDVRSVDDAGFDGDMMEAQAFAYLAARAVQGLPISAPLTTGVSAPMSGGRLSHPT
ncbi:UNVERIFIED_CONTAM: hypothetical protein GTU68_055455 [Idotea baltica]|nr:hypothetical protein [Idotea baltica]